MTKEYKKAVKVKEKTTTLVIPFQRFQKKSTPLQDAVETSSGLVLFRGGFNLRLGIVCFSVMRVSADLVGTTSFKILLVQKPRIRSAEDPVMRDTGWSLFIAIVSASKSLLPFN